MQNSHAHRNCNKAWCGKRWDKPGMVPNWTFSVQIYGGEVMREVSLCSPYVWTEHTIPWLEAFQEIMPQEKVIRSDCTTAASLSSLQHLICPLLACGGAERSLMAASVSRYSSELPKQLIVFPPTTSVPVTVGSCVLLEKVILPPTHHPSHPHCPNWTICFLAGFLTFGCQVS